MTDGVLTAEARLEQVIRNMRVEGYRFTTFSGSAPVIKAYHIDEWADELEALLSHWRLQDGAAMARLELQTTIVKWRKEAAESDHDGDFCCAVTREHNADDLEAILSRWRSAHGSREDEPNDPV